MLWVRQLSYLETSKIGGLRFFGSMYLEQKPTFKTFFYEIAIKFEYSFVRVWLYNFSVESDVFC